MAENGKKPRLWSFWEAVQGTAFEFGKQMNEGGEALGILRSTSTELEYPSTRPGTGYFPGAQDATGYIQFDGRDKKAEFKIAEDDPRYQRCEAVALQMREKHGKALAELDPKIPEQRARLVEIEKEITTALNAEIHQPSNFGDYNQATESVEDFRKHSSMHDVARRGQSYPLPTSKEFKSGESICPQYGALMNNLTSKSGMDTVRLNSIAANTVTLKDGALKGNPADYHVTVMSNATGNILEATEDGKTSNLAYRENLGGTTLDQFKAGTPIMIPWKENEFAVLSADPAKERTLNQTGPYLKEAAAKHTQYANEYYQQHLRPKEALEAEKPPAAVPGDAAKKQALDAVKDIPSEVRSQIKNDSGPSEAVLLASSERPGASPVVPSASPSTGAALA